MAYDYMKSIGFKKSEEEIEKQREIEQRPSYSIANKNIDDFFERLYIEESLEINDVKLVNREGQSMFALNVMDAISNKNILLINAGTGIGKSIGYLIPIFYTIDGVEKFKKVIISTSTIALQQQLLTSIHNVSQMLEIDVKVDIAKGMNNYLCLNNVKKLLLSNTKITEEERAIILELEEESKQLKTADKSELNKFTHNIWQKVKLSNRGICSNCSYSNNCYYLLHENNLANANILITNHSNLVYQLSRNPGNITDYDAIIIDEAHKLPEALIAVNGGEIKYDDFINNIESLDIEGFDYNYLIIALEKMFISIKNNAYGISKKTNKMISQDDSIRYNFNIYNDVKANIERAANLFKIFFKQLEHHDISNKKANAKNMEYLQKYYDLLLDMSKGNNKKNIYWAYFNQNNHISIGYVPKENTKDLEEMYNKKIPVIFTSGTLLDAAGEYDYFIKEIGLDNNEYESKVIKEMPIASPYDFEDNSLVYYNPNMPDPSQILNRTYDKNSYLISLANEINKLITITNGKSLILFTSKSDMESVHKILKAFEYPFEILIQQDNNSTEIQQKFIENTDSCLLATGTFWEGIDIKGPSLSNLIITHLPFSVPEPVIEYRASKETEDVRFERVYLNDMLQKIAQGMGRLIRSNNDTGIVCILDPRFKKYIDNVKNATPFKNFTSSLEDVENFTNEKIYKKR